MYIGNIDVAGLHHLVYEVVDNSIDEAMAGVCDLINVIVHADNSVSVIDNGRGIPVGMHKKENMPALEVVMTKLHAGGKFDRQLLQGVRRAARGRCLRRQRTFAAARSRGVQRRQYLPPDLCQGPKDERARGLGKTHKRGTKVHFLADPEIFTVTEFSNDILIRRLRELAFLNKGVRITFEDERSDVKEEFFYKGGIIAFCEHLNRRNTPRCTRRSTSMVKRATYRSRSPSSTTTPTSTRSSPSPTTSTPPRAGHISSGSSRR